jgi:hypothetical protein
VIQRIQSVYIGLVAILFAAMFLNSIVSIQAANQEFIYSIFGLHIKNVKALNIGILTTFLLGLSLSIVALAIYGISLFKNRIKQMTMVRFNSLLILVFIVMMVLGFNKACDTVLLEAKLANPNNMHITYLFGCVIPFVALILNTLGFRGIKKDEELVRSADRLR